MSIEEPTNFSELYEAFNLADRTACAEYTEYAESTSVEDRVTLLENRILIMGVCFNKILALLAAQQIDG